MRRRLQRYRLPIAGAAGGVGAVLGAIYEQIETSMRIAAILAIGLLTTLAVLLTDSGTTPEPSRSGSPEADRDRGGRPAEPSRRPLRWRLRWPRRVAPGLPTGDEVFRGRTRELEVLLQHHDRARAARQPGGQPDLTRLGRRRVTVDNPATGPVLLLIHGKPGVGKSALAQELARRLADQYPDGQVYANLGTLGTARTPAEILKILLSALGWPEPQPPTDTVQLAKIFRSLTAQRRMLFILDAARHAEHVKLVLPADPEAAVIVTSRRDLGPHLNTTSHPLEVPDTDEAIAILRAASRTDDGTRPECAAEIVQLCGRLPLAIRAAAERVSLDGTQLGHVAELLRPPHSRLRLLERPGRSVMERIASEYDRLLEQEKRALRLLTLLDSPTFTPWVLRPLLRVSVVEAENLATRLAAAQMLDNDGTDQATGLARYTFHPLVRLFAYAQRVDQEPDTEVDEARRRLDLAYRGIIVSVLTEQDPSLVTRKPDQQWLPEDSGLIRTIAQRPEPWIRAEYPTLLRHIRLAWDRQDYPVCWRIAAQLSGVPENVDTTVDTKEILDAYELAAKAAQEGGDSIGLADVLLAQGSFLAAVEQYDAADETLCRARDLAHDLRRTGDPRAEDAKHRECAALRRIGEAHLQMAAYRLAADTLRRAFAAATACTDNDEARLVGILLAETHHMNNTDPSYVDVLDGRIGDTPSFRALLGFAEEARRRREWQTAIEHLQHALSVNSHDIRRAATVRYRLARLHLSQHLEEHGRPGPLAQQVPVPPYGSNGDGAGPSPADHAVRRAAESALLFRRMGNPIGLVRAHCLLARALLAAGHLVEAEHIVRAADQEFAILSLRDDATSAPLNARLLRARGEVLLCRGNVDAGRDLLLQAATIFGEQHDWAAQDEVLRRLTDALAALPQPAALR